MSPFLVQRSLVPRITYICLPALLASVKRIIKMWVDGNLILRDMTGSVKQLFTFRCTLPCLAQKSVQFPLFFFFCILRTSVSLISLGENTSYPEKNLASSLVRSHPYTSPFSDTVMQPILQLTTCGWHDKQANLISSQRMKTSVSNDLIAVVRRFHRRSRCYAGHELWNSSYKGPYLALRPPCANFGICLTKDTYLGLLCCYYLSTHMLPSCFLFWIIAINAES